MKPINPLKIVEDVWTAVWKAQNPLSIDQFVDEEFVLTQSQDGNRVFVPTMPSLRRARSNCCSLILTTAISSLIMILVYVHNAAATVDVFTISGRPVTLSLIEQNREEVWNWFNPGALKRGPEENRYNFLGSWIRLGATYEFGGIKGFAELMSPFFINLPNGAICPLPQGPLGLGANYYQPHENVNDASVFLKQGYVEFGRGFQYGLDVRGGRFEFLDGAEYQPDKLDPELRWLLLNRISQRLVANFGFSDVMRSFDGALVSYGNDKWQATLMYGVPTKGVFDLKGMDEIRNLDLLYASLNAGPTLFSSGLWGESFTRLFYVYYNDTRRVALIDNRNLTGANADTSPVSIDTVGADYVRAQHVGKGVIDFLVWTAGQFGAWGNQSQRSYAFVAEGGYRFDSIAWQPWFRFGYTVGSGDDNPKDGAHETFFQILPTPRLYAFFPFFNIMNMNEAMGQLVLNPLPAVEVETSLHGLWLDSSKDLWYTGGGAYNNSIFGYTGRPSVGHGYLGTLADCQLSWKINRHFALELYYGHAFGGSVVGANYSSGREGDFGFIQTTWTL